MRNVKDDVSDKRGVDSKIVNRSLQRLQETAENHPYYMSIKRFLGIRPKVDLEQFFHWYYDSKIFYEATDTTSSSYWEIVLKFITRSDPALADVDQASFRIEMKSMWMAVISLALKDSLLDRDMARKEIPRYILAEIGFRRNYLEENGHPEIWENMLIYNQAMSKDIPERRAGCEFIRKFLLKEINEDYKAYIENIYLIGRLDSTVRNLIVVSAQKLGWDLPDLNSDTFLSFEVVALTHYGDAKGLLDIVNLQL